MGTDRREGRAPASLSLRGPWPIAGQAGWPCSARGAPRRTRRLSGRACSSLKAVRTRSTALGRIAPEDGEVGEDGEMGEAGVRGPLSACPPGVETCRQIRTLSEAG